MAEMTKNQAIFLLLSLLMGLGSGYFIGQYPIPELKQEINNLNQEVIELESQVEEKNEEINELENNYDNLSLRYSNLQNELNTLNSEYSSLQKSYTKMKHDYEELLSLIPFNVSQTYLQLKNSTEGKIEAELKGVCGEDYILPSPKNADNWDINITIASELSTQPVHITIYTIYDEYPPDYSAQPFAPNVRGVGQATLTMSLNTSYAYVVSIRDAYAKPFTGKIEEHWYPSNP